MNCMDWTCSFRMLLIVELAGVLAGLTIAAQQPSQTRALMSITVTSVPAPGLPGEGQSPNQTVEIEGVGAGAFNPDRWLTGHLHILPDVRRPILAPKLAGVFRNIYAGYALEEPWGWRVFYSAWDGTNDPHDRIYEASTKDFLDFDNRHTVIEPGEFVHTSNVVVGKRPQGGYFMLATAADELPGPFKSTNKPVIFSSSTGDSWNGATVPYKAKASDIINIQRYPKYTRADLNGANVLIEEPGVARFYFTDWTHPGAVFWADGPDERHLLYRINGPVALKTIHAANDVQIFDTGGKHWYLMGLYKKGDVGLTARDSEHLWYSLSTDPHSFPDERILLTTTDPLDRYIFSIGFVRRGNRFLGVLYGAGDEAGDNHNQIFASWLQKRVELVARSGFNDGNGATYEAVGALGPDRQRFRLPDNRPFDGELRVYDDDGVTPLGSASVHLEPGRVYRIELAAQPQTRK